MKEIRNTQFLYSNINFPCI